MPTQIRSSSAPLYYECGQAAVPAAHPCGLNAAMAGSIGDTVHTILAEYVHLDNDADIEAMIVDHSNAHAADATEVRFLVHWSLDHWRSIKEDFPDPMTELELTATLPGGNWILTGHPDIISIDRENRRAKVLDYKTGRDPGNFRHQLNAYSFLIMQNDLDIDEVKATQLDVRSSRADTTTSSRKIIDEWAAYYVGRLEDGQYRMGNHCGKCPRRGECPRISEWLRQIAAAFRGDKHIEPPEDKAEWGPFMKDAFDNCKQLEYHLKDFRSGLKALLKATGPLPLGNGESFGIVEKPSEDIDAGLAYQRVQHATKTQPEQFLRGVTISKKSIQELCLSAAAGETDKERRQAARRIELTLLGELRAAGACTQSTAEYLEVI